MAVNSPHKEMVMKTMKTMDKFRGYIAILITIGMLAMLGTLLGISIPDKSRDVVMFGFGVVAAIVKDVYGWYFGSSEGSNNKTEMMGARIDAIVDKQPVAQPVVEEKEVP
jgi:hypothetical protein